MNRSQYLWCQIQIIFKIICLKIKKIPIWNSNSNCLLSLLSYRNIINSFLILFNLFVLKQEQDLQSEMSPWLCQPLFQMENERNLLKYFLFMFRLLLKCVLVIFSIWNVQLFWLEDCDRFSWRASHNLWNKIKTIGTDCPYLTWLLV